MKTYEIIQLVTFVVAASIARSGFAAEETEAGTPPESAAHDKADKTGTNPLNFQNTLQLKNEFNKIGGEYANFTRLRYDQPLRPNLKVGLELPLMATDLPGTGEFGLSDMIFRGTWIPHVTKKIGVALAADLTVPTATDDVLGDEKWELAPTCDGGVFPAAQLYLRSRIQARVQLRGSKWRTARWRSCRIRCSTRATAWRASSALPAINRPL